MKRGVAVCPHNKYLFRRLLVLLILFIPVASQALEFTADDIQIVGYDPASRYLGFVLTTEAGGGNEVWWVV
jgi:hypothetical protein